MTAQDLKLDYFKFYDPIPWIGPSGAQAQPLNSHLDFVAFIEQTTQELFHEGRLSPTTPARGTCGWAEGRVGG
jgi:hypothetical protein